QPRTGPRTRGPDPAPTPPPAPPRPRSFGSPPPSPPRPPDPSHPRLHASPPAPAPALPFPPSHPLSGHRTHAPHSPPTSAPAPVRAVSRGYSPSGTHGRSVLLAQPICSLRTGRAPDPRRAWRHVLNGCYPDVLHGTGRTAAAAHRRRTVHHRSGGRDGAARQ